MSVKGKKEIEKKIEKKTKKKTKLKEKKERNRRGRTGRRRLHTGQSFLNFVVVVGGGTDTRNKTNRQIALYGIIGHGPLRSHCPSFVRVLFGRFHGILQLDFFL